MIVKFKKTFLKDLENLPEDTRKRVEKIVFIQIPKIQRLIDISNIKKIKGCFYRIRIGDYRIGFEWRNGEVIFYRVLHRKDIYKYFP